MKNEANQQQREMEVIIEEIAENEGFNVENIKSVSEESAQKTSKIMETYLGEDLEICTKLAKQNVSK
jgi:hypothetical protein